jgi:hypothetical protein
MFPALVPLPGEVTVVAKAWAIPIAICDDRGGRVVAGAVDRRCVDRAPIGWAPIDWAPIDWAAELDAERHLGVRLLRRDQKCGTGNNSGHGCPGEKSFGVDDRETFGEVHDILLVVRVTHCLQPALKGTRVGLGKMRTTFLLGRVGGDAGFHSKAQVKLEAWLGSPARYLGQAG